MGTVIFFGMAFATMVTLFVIPAMYRLISAATQAPGHVEHDLNKQLEHDTKARVSHG